MANKVSYAKLNLKVNTDTNIFTFNDTEIEVKKYLPIEDKQDLIDIVLQKAEKEEGIYDDLLLDTYFHLYLVYMYTDISFTDKQRENELKIYDTLASNGFFDKFLLAIDETEYNDLLRKLNKTKEDNVRYKNTTARIIKNAIGDLPKQAEAVANIMNNFSPEEFQNVMKFATIANGNRPIPAEIFQKK